MGQVALVTSIDTMAVGVATIAAFVALAASLLVIKDLRLPYPCFDPVVTIPAEHVPAPSDLFGPYTPNRYLQKAKKLFEHRIKGVGAHCSSLDPVRMHTLLLVALCAAVTGSGVSSCANDLDDYGWSCVCRDGKHQS